MISIIQANFDNDYQNSMFLDFSNALPDDTVYKLYSDALRPEKVNSMIESIYVPNSLTLTTKVKTF